MWSGQSLDSGRRLSLVRGLTATTTVYGGFPDLIKPHTHTLAAAVLVQSAGTATTTVVWYSHDDFLRCFPISYNTMTVLLPFSAALSIDLHMNVYMYIIIHVPTYIYVLCYSYGLILVVLRLEYTLLLHSTALWMIDQ